MESILPVTAGLLGYNRLRHLLTGGLLHQIVMGQNWRQPSIVQRMESIHLVIVVLHGTKQRHRVVIGGQSHRVVMEQNWQLLLGQVAQIQESTSLQIED